MVTQTQIILLLLAVAAYLAGGIAAVLRVSGKNVPAWIRFACLAAGVTLSTGLLAWHSATTGDWQPLQDSFAALLTLAVLLAAFVSYIQIHRPMASLEWLTMPVVILLLLLAGHFGAAQPHTYLTTTFSLGHRVTAFLGTLAFVVAGASGVLYLISDQMLRPRHAGKKHLPPHPGIFGSLERLERLTYSSVILGFALFTLGILTGISWVLHEHSTRLGPHWFITPKVLLSFAAWAIFAVVLHTPIAPRLRGRKTAILSIIGLVLALATLFAVLLMPNKQPPKTGDTDASTLVGSQMNPKGVA